jgi:hypothetical protein
VVPLSGCRFDARRLSNRQPAGLCGTFISMRQLGYWKLLCAHVDLGGRGRISVRLRQLLLHRFGGL